MNLKHIQKNGEDDHFFHLHDTRDGKDFKVSKKGLSATLHGRIAQHFAEGGEAMDAVPDASGDANAAFAASLSQDPVTTYGFGSGSAMNPAPGSEATSAAPTPTMQAAIDAGGTYGAATPPPSAETPKEAKPEAAPADEAPQPPTAIAAPKPAGTGYSVSADDRAIARANEAEIKAAQQKAELEAKRFSALDAERQGSMSAQQKLFDLTQQQVQANLTQQKQAADDLRNQKIDPDRFWTKKSTAGKVGNIISILLGGIGQGLAGGPNVALQMLNQEAERDVEAQKEELGKKKTYYSMMVDQGHSLQDSYKLTLAHQQAVLEGHVQSIADRYAGAETKPMADALVAQLQQQRIQRTQEAHSARLKNALEQEDLKSKQIQNALNGNQIALMPIQRELQMRTAMGQGVDPRYGPFMDPKTTVKGEDGLLYAANDEKDATDLRDLQAATTKLKAAALAAKQLRKEHSGGTYPAMMGGNKGATARGANLSQELKDVVAEMSSKMKSNPATAKELSEFITDPSNWTTTDTTVNAQMDALIDRANRAVQAEMRARVRNGAGMKSTGLSVKRAGD